MIKPEYLAALRHRLRAEMVLVLVQLEQVCPSWWLDLSELATALGTDRATLNRSLRRLEDLGLIRRASIANGGGTYIWWVSRHEADAPADQAEPAWLLRDIKRRETHRVPISKRWAWAEQEGIPRETMRNFLMGGQTVMRDRWQLVGTPLDQISQEVVA